MPQPPFLPEHVLSLWYPNEDHLASVDAFSAWISERMYGGLDPVICGEFAELTQAAAEGALDHWTETPEGRVALLLALDQFPRSLWRDTPAAYAQDIKANLLVLEAVQNGHFAAVPPYMKLFHLIALGHCEGPDHLARLDLMDELTEVLIAEMPPQHAGLEDLLRGQNAKVRAVITRFGRHPHRNPHYGRVSSPAEAAYIATGQFPHVQGNAPLPDSS